MYTFDDEKVGRIEEEEVTKTQRFFLGPSRAFMLHVYDNDGIKLMKITRQSSHLFGLSKAFVYAYPDGDNSIVLIGSVQEKRRLFHRRYSVSLASGNGLEPFGLLWSRFRRWSYVYSERSMDGVRVERLSKGYVCSNRDLARQFFIFQCVKC